MLKEESELGMVMKKSNSEDLWHMNNQTLARSSTEYSIERSIEISVEPSIDSEGLAY